MDKFKALENKLQQKLEEETDKDVVSKSVNSSDRLYVVTEIAKPSNPSTPEKVEIVNADETNNLSVPSSNNTITNNIAEADIHASEPFDRTNIVKNLEELKKKTLLFDTYIDLLSFFSDVIQNREMFLHPWQMEIGKEICEFKATISNPLKYVLCASNGSGKDSFCIAPLAVWFVLCKLKSRVVITSSSGQQLTAQTETYIRNLCETINTFLITELGQPPAFKINQRYIRCLYTGSEIRMYATDEPGKAEGYHPMEPNAPFLIIVNEAKTVDELIFQAIARCTGFSHKIYVSSPGEPKGSFWRAFTDPRLKWHSRRITSYDCTHIPREEIETDLIELGLHSSTFRSKHLALFTSVGGTVVITEDNVTKCLNSCKTRIGADWPKRVGIDLAVGGDECVIDICKGNKSIYHFEFKEKDATITADIINRELLKNDIPKNHAYIKADDGGVGRPIISILERLGWTVTRVLNQSPARDKRMYGNRGAEMWFRYSRLIQECLWLLEDDNTNNPTLMGQLTSRHYRQSTGGNNRLFLQDKKEAKAEGHPSPDRADARVLANSDLTVEDFLNATSTEVKSQIVKSSLITLAELVDAQEKQKYAFAERQSGNPYVDNRLLHYSTSGQESIMSDFSATPSKVNRQSSNHSLFEFI